MTIPFTAADDYGDHFDGSIDDSDDTPHAGFDAIDGLDEPDLL
jgi:hypothetical protein